MSAALLLVAGIALLFAPDQVLPNVVPAYPKAALWLAQLLGAAWLGVAGLNWLHRASLLGGIYGRPVVVANMTLYFVSALVLLKAAGRMGASPALWPVSTVVAVLAAAYGYLLFRGPLARDLRASGISNPG